MHCNPVIVQAQKHLLLAKGTGWQSSASSLCCAPTLKVAHAEKWQPESRARDYGFLQL